MGCIAYSCVETLGKNVQEFGAFIQERVQGCISGCQNAPAYWTDQVKKAPGYWADQVQKAPTFWWGQICAAPTYWTKQASDLVQHCLHTANTLNGTDIPALRGRMIQVEEDNANLREALGKTQRNLFEQADKSSRLEIALTTIETANRKVSLDKTDLRDKLQESQTSVQSQSAQIEALTKEVATFRLQAEGLKEEVDRLKERLTGKEKEAAASKKEKESLFREKIQLERTAETNQNITQDVSKKLETALSENSLLKKQIADLRKKAR